MQFIWFTIIHTHVSSHAFVELANDGQYHLGYAFRVLDIFA